MSHESYVSFRKAEIRRPHARPPPVVLTPSPFAPRPPPVVPTPSPVVPTPSPVVPTPPLYPQFSPTPYHEVPDVAYQGSMGVYWPLTYTVYLRSSHLTLRVPNSDFTNLNMMMLCASMEASYKNVLNRTSSLYETETVKTPEEVRSLVGESASNAGVFQLDYRAKKKLFPSHWSINAIPFISGAIRGAVYEKMVLRLYIEFYYKMDQPNLGQLLLDVWSGSDRLEFPESTLWADPDLMRINMDAERYRLSKSTLRISPQTI